MDRKRKRIVIGFVIFLSFMALCTLIAKGIYTSGLAIVSVTSPTSNSLVHEVNVSGKVKEGQEYGVYVDSGLRVATIKIRKGESFSIGAALFQIDTSDLRNVINTYETELLQLGTPKTKYEKAVYKEKESRILRLQKLLDDNGWIYAGRSGKVTDVAISVGNRTQDAASLLYALDEGKKIVEMSFTKEQTEHLTLGCVFQMKVKQKDGSTVTEDIVLAYLDKKSDGQSEGEMFFENDNVALGQTAELSYKKRTDIYHMCIRKDFIQQSGVSGKCVYIVEEYEGILGTEWRVRSVPITIVDENDTMAAIESADIMDSTRIVASSSKELKDGDVVRVLE